jgi:hypothetical protein
MLRLLDMSGALTYDMGNSPITPNERVTRGTKIYAYAEEIVVAQCFNVRNLHITTTMRTDLCQNGLDEELVKFIRNFVVLLPCLKRLVVDVPAETCGISSSNGKVIRRLKYPTVFFNETIGIQHDWTGIESDGLVTLTWDAVKGQNIKWTDDQYCQSLPWAHSTLLPYTVASLLHRAVLLSKQNLHFLGLNPRVLLHLCRRKLCQCALPAMKRQALDPARWVKLNSIFSSEPLDGEPDDSIYKRIVGTSDDSGDSDDAFHLSIPALQAIQWNLMLQEMAQSRHSLT